jgi:hypothetical protein
VGEAHLLHDRDAVALADAERAGGPLARAVDGQDRGVVERGSCSSSPRVRDMWWSAKTISSGRSELLLQQVLHPELLREPGVHRLAEDGHERGKVENAVVRMRSNLMIGFS